MSTFERMFSRRSFVVAGSAALLGLAQGAAEPACALEYEGAELLTWSCHGASVRYPGSWQVVDAGDRWVEFALDPADTMAQGQVDVDVYASPVDAAELLALKVQEAVAGLQSASGWLLTRVETVQEGAFDARTCMATIPYRIDRVDDPEQSLRGMVHIRTDGTTLVSCGFIATVERWFELEPTITALLFTDCIEIDAGAPWATTKFAESGVEDAGAGQVTLYNASGVPLEGEPLVEEGARYSTVQVGIEFDGFDAGPIHAYVDGRIAATYDIPGQEPFHVALTLGSGSLLPGTHTVEVARLEGEDVAVYKKIRYTAA